MTTDRYRSATAAAVLLVAGIAAVISYQHILTLAIRYGESELSAWLLPLSIDGAVLTSSLVMLRSARLQVSAPWLARAMLVLSVGATLACNVAYGLPHGWPGALLSGWPAVAFIGSAEVAISMSRRAAESPLTAAAADIASAAASVAATKPVTAARPEPVTGAQAQRSHRAKSKQSRRGGNLEERRAHRAALEAEAMAALAAEPGIGATELGRRLGCSTSTAQRILRELRATQPVS